MDQSSIKANTNPDETAFSHFHEACLLMLWWSLFELLHGKISSASPRLLVYHSGCEFLHHRHVYSILLLCFAPVASHQSNRVLLWKVKDNLIKFILVSQCCVFFVAFSVCVFESKTETSDVMHKTGNKEIKNTLGRNWTKLLTNVLKHADALLFNFILHAFS